jgi:hypothetical protein
MLKTSDTHTDVYKPLTFSGVHPLRFVLKNKKAFKSFRSEGIHEVSSGFPACRKLSGTGWEPRCASFCSALIG